jgi:hypothetical protein
LVCIKHITQINDLSNDVGESTCKLLPFELGCAYVGSKGVALEGKSKGATRKGTIKVT